jgi:type IV fimbrial biogenesis protein FimT
MLDRMPAARGVTLIELTIVLAFVAIIAGYVVPTFVGLVLDSRRTAAVVSTLHAISLARQLAAIRGESIRLCGSQDARQCSGRTDWSTGLLVTDESDSLHRSLPLPVSGRSSAIRSNRSDVAFEGGSGFATPATVTICDRRGSSAARAVIISRSGRPRVSTSDSGGEPLSC